MLRRCGGLFESGGLFLRPLRDRLREQLSDEERAQLQDIRASARAIILDALFARFDTDADGALDADERSEIHAAAAKRAPALMKRLRGRLEARGGFAFSADEALGYLNEEQVNDYLVKIEALPSSI